MVANSMLYDKKLALNVIYPYKAFIEANNLTQDSEDSINWCNI
jgi:hypothetical protein